MIHKNNEWILTVKHKLESREEHEKYSLQNQLAKTDASVNAFGK